MLKSATNVSLTSVTVCLGFEEKCENKWIYFHTVSDSNVCQGLVMSARPYSNFFVEGAGRHTSSTYDCHGQCFTARELSVLPNINVPSSLLKKTQTGR